MDKIKSLATPTVVQFGIIAFGILMVSKVMVQWNFYAAILLFSGAFLTNNNKNLKNSYIALGILNLLSWLF